MHALVGVETTFEAFTSVFLVRFIISSTLYSKGNKNENVKEILKK